MTTSPSDLKIVVFGYIKDQAELDEIRRVGRYAIRQAPRRGGCHAKEPYLQADYFIPFWFSPGRDAMHSQSLMHVLKPAYPAANKAGDSASALGRDCWILQVEPTKVQLDFIIDPRGSPAGERGNPRIGLARLR